MIIPDDEAEETPRRMGKGGLLLLADGTDALDAIVAAGVKVGQGKLPSPTHRPKLFIFDPLRDPNHRRQ